jgi:hypothetical protein
VLVVNLGLQTGYVKRLGHKEDTWAMSHLLSGFRERILYVLVRFLGGNFTKKYLKKSGNSAHVVLKALPFPTSNSKPRGRGFHSVKHPHNPQEYHFCTLRVIEE